MPARIRLLLAAAIVALSALGGAAYAGRAAAADASAIVADRRGRRPRFGTLLGRGDPTARR